ncbi:methyl-accepting chemotaxis protein [Bosea sp. LjRoot90]|uniref:methyl-accepting chemotaxis protein n=1 Tax=Bosea sp. LjRoot90 TaxID=3342342 RepID=UPI003ECFE93D
MKKLASLWLPISNRLAILGVVIIAAAVAASVVLSIRAADSAMRERAQASLIVNSNLLRDVLTSKGEARLDGDKLYFGSELVNGNFAAVDKVKALSGGTATVFMGDTRVSTNVQKPDGSRAVGTKLAQGPAYDAVFKERRTYSGAADILGIPYFTIYEPIIQTSNNAVIGILYVGIKQSDFLTVIDEMIRNNVAAGLVIAAIGGALLFWLTRRMLRPLGQLKETMLKLAAGDLASEPPKLRSGDEVAAMADAVAILRQAAIEKARLETEATEQSERSDSERRSNQAERERAAEQQRDHARQQEAIVRALASGLERLAQADLTCRIEDVFPAEYEQLRADFNEAVDRLAVTVSTIQATSAEVGMAAREINTGADDLSKRTEEQASSLEETAATTEELAASVKASAQGARQAAAIAEEAMKAAQDGGAIAGEAVAAMARIEQASKKISDIIRVIDDIAFQTNLLALNAAVEAARAGDAGKGFAVVASEVRTLAQRSSEAAKDISGLISSSNSEVETGVKLVRRAGDSLEKILSASQKVTGTIQEISAASAEQAHGIDEMSQAVAHLDEMTQANAALAEQSAASAGALSGRISELNTLVASFRTGSNASIATATGSASAGPVARPAATRVARPSARPTVPESEPQRLRQLAEAAFAQSKAAAPRREPRPAAPAQPRKAANGRAGDDGWEEF